MLRALHVFFLLALLPLGRAEAQAPVPAEAGRPFFVQRFASEEYGLHDQNWAVAQGPDGVLYVGNTNGILAFDGERWETYPVPNETARSLAVDGKGRLHAGLVGDLGRLEADPWGRLHFQSLLPHVPEEHRHFADVWTAHALGTDVFFQAFDRLFRWDGTRMHVWTTPGRFHKAFEVRGVLYVREEGEGLKRVEGEALVPVPGGETFAEERIDVLLPHGEDGLLVGARNRGFMLWEGGRLRPFPTEAEAHLAERRLYHGIALEGGSYALTTIQGSVLLMDQQGRVQHILGAEVGLRAADLVLYVHQDHQGGLWLALNEGLLRVDAPTQLTIFDRDDGLEGTVISTIRHAGTLYVSTTSGLYRLSPGQAGRGGPGAQPRFTQVEGTGTQSWAMTWLDDDLLGAENAGVFVLEEGRARQVTGRKTFALRLSEIHPGRVYAGLKEGLEVLERRGGAWRSAGLVEGVRAEVRSLVEDEEGALWLGTLYDGVLRVELEGNRAARVEHLGVQEGLGEGPVVAVDLLGRPALLTRDGLYRPTGARAGRRFRPMAELNEAIGFGEAAHLYLTAGPTEDADVWLARDGRVERYIRLPDGSYVLRTPPVLEMPGLDVRTVHLDEDGVVWVGTDSRLLRFDPRVEKDYAAPYQALVRHASIRREGLLFAGAEGERWTPPVLRHHDNSLYFSFSAPTFNAPEATLYQFWLEGFDEGWSSWGPETWKEYTNLPEARYRFHVRARNAHGTLSRPGTFHFEVRPPWYRTWWAYGLYVLAFAGVVWGTGTLRLRRQARELERRRLLNEQLERANARLREANERLHRADQLKDDVLANTSHELRTPLTSILGFAAVLEEELEGEESHFAGLIRRSGERLLATVDALLEMASLQAELLDLEPEAFDLTEEAAAVVERLRPEAEAQGLYLTLMPHSARLPVHLDRRSVGRVLGTLVGNAIKFTREGGVTVLLDASEAEVELVVRDTGIGISEAFRPALFRAFEQASSGYGRTHEGTGLGLAIVHRIVQLLGGEIGVESPPEGGTLFRVRLPRQDPRRAAEAEAPLPRGARVLLVEAEGRPLAELREMLALHAHVVTAVGEAEAMRRAQEEAFDLLVLEGHLPASNGGPPLLSRLRALPGLGGVPALAVTAYHLPGEREQFRAMGFEEHLAQPISPRRLAALLEGLLGVALPS